MNILFDLDGTLTDPFEGITRCIEYALHNLGRPSPPAEDLAWCIGPPLKQSLSKLLETEDDNQASKALSLYRERFGKKGLYENRVYPGIPDVLEELSQTGHRLYLATAKPEIYADRIMEHFDLRPYFTNIYGSELDGTRTDKTKLIAYILKKENQFAKETVMVGDRKHDMAGAKNNRVRGVGVLWGYGTQNELAEAGAVQCVATPEELSLVMKNIKPGHSIDL